MAPILGLSGGTGDRGRCLGKHGSLLEHYSGNDKAADEAALSFSSGDRCQRSEAVRSGA
jgi:hypothetical protein